MLRGAGRAGCGRVSRRAAEAGQQQRRVGRSPPDVAGEIGVGFAARLRHEGVSAEALENGVAGWASVGLPMVPETVLPTRDSEGRTVWVTRGRPKVDRIACPWLIRRFVDPSAIFLFVAPSEVDRKSTRLNSSH